MRVFISYAQEDRPKAEHLAQRLRELGQEPWSDTGLFAGQTWWDEILSRIRAADALLLLISPLFLVSQACLLERQYAALLGKQLVPVMVAPVPHHILPTELAPLQIVDYVSPGESSAYAFAKAVASIRPARPLPHPLPPLPPVPLSYLNGLRDRLAQPSLTMNEQLEMVDVLGRGAYAEDSEERHAARELLGMLSRRGDLFEVTSRRIFDTMNQIPTPHPPAHALAHPPAPPTTGIPTPVKVLAWIGAALLALVLLAWLTSPSDTQCFYDAWGFLQCS